MDNEVSPLAAFPQEHPTPVMSPTPHKPFYKSKMFLISLVILVLIGTGVVFYPKVLSKKQIASTAPKPTIFQPTPASKIAAGNMYTNTKYSYVVEHVSSVPTKTTTTGELSSTQFLGGCFNIYAVPKGSENTLTEESNGIPWKQLDDLKSMPEGEKRNCSVMTFTFGADRKAIIDRNDYKKLPMQKTANATWYAFEVQNSINPQAVHNVYFTQGNKYTYVIETFSGGSCSKDIAADMFSHFVIM